MTDGDVLWGLGSTDMKGGLAVMLDLAATVPRPAHDVTYVFYVAEEIARAHSGLLQLASRRPELLEADAAIVCEPTNSAVEAGCQGVIKAEVVLAGRRAHVARPWMGRNAVHRLAPVLALLDGWPPRRAVVDGCEYRESLQAVRRGGRRRRQRRARPGFGRAQLPLRSRPRPGRRGRRTGGNVGPVPRTG